MTLPQLRPELLLSTQMAKSHGQTDNFMPLLNHAVDSGHSGAVEKLLALGLKPTPCKSVVRYAVSNDNGSNAQLLVQGAVSKFSALHHAAWKGDAATAELLLDNGALPHIELNATVDYAQRGVFQQLFPAINGTNDILYNVTPLQVAANAASLPVVELLVARGAKTHEHQFLVPKGADGDLVAGFLQTRGSKPVTRR